MVHSMQTVQKMTTIYLMAQVKSIVNADKRFLFLL